MTLITIQNNKVSVDPTQFAKIIPTKEFPSVSFAVKLSPKVLDLIKLLNLKKEQIISLNASGKSILTAKFQYDTIIDLEKKYEVFSKITEEIKKLQTLNYALAPSAERIIKKTTELKEDINSIRQITKMEYQISQFNEKNGYNNNPNYLYFKEKKDQLFHRLSIVDGTNGFTPTQFGRNTTRQITSPDNIQKLTLDQKKFLVLDAILLEQISTEAEYHS